MKQISNLSIPEPCAQNWDNMVPNASGKFCTSCQKSVTDFSQLSNKEILDLLSSSTGNVCGRFKSEQLEALNSQLASDLLPLFGWRKFGLAAALIAAVPFVNVQAKIKAPVEQTPISPSKPNTAPIADTLYQKITGHITDQNDKQGVPGVTVRIKGTTKTCATDINGNFLLSVPVVPDLTLVTSFVGYLSQETKVTPGQLNYPIELAISQSFSGEVVITRPPLWKRPYYTVRRLARRIFR